MNAGSKVDEMNGKEIARRARAIRLERKRLAALAGIDEDTAWRTFSGRTVPLVSTMDKMKAALVREERRLLAYLVGIHGVPKQKTEPKTAA